MSSGIDTSDDDNIFGCFLIVCAVIFVGFIVFMFTVVGPSHDNRQKRCEEANGVIIKGGACVKKESLVGY